MWQDIFFIVWFFTPMGVANITPILVAKVPLFSVWTQPLDGYRTFRQRRILGDHKTWRGVCCGIMMAILASVFLSIPLLFGFLLGFGALFGDAVKSFIKRQLNIPSGKPFFVLDQIDYVLGALVCTMPFVRFSVYQIILAIFLWGGLSFVMSYIGFLFKFKKDPI